MRAGVAPGSRAATRRAATGRSSGARLIGAWDGCLTQAAAGSVTDPEREPTGRSSRLIRPARRNPTACRFSASRTTPARDEGGGLGVERLSQAADRTVPCSHGSRTVAASSLIGPQYVAARERREDARAGGSARPCEAAGGVGCTVVGSQCISPGGPPDIWLGSETERVSSPLRKRGIRSASRTNRPATPGRRSGSGSKGP